MPTTEAYEQGNAKIVENLKQVEKTLQTGLEQIEVQNSIIGRYDEILCEKAQRVELTLMQQQFDCKIKSVLSELKKSCDIGNSARELREVCREE